MGDNGTLAWPIRFVMPDDISINTDGKVNTCPCIRIVKN